MSGARKTASFKTDPAAHWDQLLRPQVKSSPDLAREFLERLRAAKLTFGKRVHCPFLRPAFLSPEDERRVRQAAETVVRVAERLANQALRDRSLLQQFRLSPDEERLVRLPMGGGWASTASRLDAFLEPSSLRFTEYNGESPAGPGYSETLATLFAELPVMEEFRKRFEVHSYPLGAKLLDALVATYRDWGGTTDRPQVAIVDWHEVPTWSEFEILQERFERMRVPTVVADPRELAFDGKHLWASGRKIDLVYRRVLINDILARPKECAALLDAYAAGAVCVANTFRCKIPHVKAFFAVLTEARNDRYFATEERTLIRRHVPWTRIVEDVRTDYDGEPIELLRYMRRHQRRLVMKPSDEYGGKGVTLGWEVSVRQWERSIEQALSGGKLPNEQGCWVVQERIPARRGTFPYIGAGHKVEFRKMLVDFAPYLFRGKVAGFLTRLSGTSLANVTSGGGQIPSFRVERKRSTEIERAS